MQGASFDDTSSTRSGAARISPRQGIELDRNGIDRLHVVNVIELESRVRLSGHGYA
jgi:hypothetical protein